MADNKKRDTIHVSFNDKKYYKDMKKIVDAWDKEGDVRSKKVCEDVLSMEKVRNSMTLNKLLNTFEWIENTLLPGFPDKYDEVFKLVVEQIFSGVISINGDKLSEFLSNPFAKVEEARKACQAIKAQQDSVQAEVASTTTEKEEVVVKEVIQESNTENSKVPDTTEKVQEKQNIVEDNNNNDNSENNSIEKENTQENINSTSSDNDEKDNSEDNKDENNKDDDNTTKTKKFGKNIMKSFN